MKLYAIADLHLDGGAGKPMDIFGIGWENHAARAFDAWRALVTDEDAVLVPGDITWAMRFEEALPDLIALSELPGRKILLRGNHDFWWASATRMRERLPECMKIIQNDAVDMGGSVVCGSRGWLLPTDKDFKAADRKIFDRELLRLEMSLKAADRLAAGEKPIICMLHFPPLHSDGEPTGFTEILEKHSVSVCCYGHLHGPNAWEVGFKGEKNGVTYSLVSADSLEFKPKLIYSTDL